MRSMNLCGRSRKISINSWNVVVMVLRRQFSSQYAEKVQNLRMNFVAKQQPPQQTEKIAETASTPPRKNSEVTKSFRINRCLPGYSRRQADLLIQQGRVQINGRPAVIGEFVIAGDKILIDRRPVDWEAYLSDQFQPLSTQKQTKSESSHVYLKLWKEKNVICTTSNNDGLNNLLQVYKLATHFPGVRLFPVGRLDKDSTGVLLLTSDPSFQTSLLSATTIQSKASKGSQVNEKNIEKVYEVTLDQEVSREILEKWRKGFSIEVPDWKKSKSKDSNKQQEAFDQGDAMVTIQLKPCKVRRLQTPSQSPDSKERTKSVTYEITLTEGKNRQLRRMASAFRLNALAIHRTRFCGISLQGLSQPGSWALLTSEEIQFLQRSLS